MRNDLELRRYRRGFLFFGLYYFIAMYLFVVFAHFNNISEWLAETGREMCL